MTLNDLNLIINPVGFSAFPSSRFPNVPIYKEAKSSFELYSSESKFGIEWTGRIVITQELTYVYSVKRIEDNKPMLVKTVEGLLIALENVKKENSSLKMPVYCYDPTISNAARFSRVFDWYMGDILGFVSEPLSSNYGFAEVNKYSVKNMYGDILFSINLVINDDNDTEGTLTRNIGNYKYIEYTFKDTDDMIKGINSLVGPEALSNAAKMINISEKTTNTNFNNVNVSNNSGENMTSAKEFIKNALIEALKNLE